MNLCPNCYIKSHCIESTQGFYVEDIPCQVCGEKFSVSNCYFNEEYSERYYKEVRDNGKDPNNNL